MKEKKKGKTKIPPKIEIEFIGQDEEQARIEQEKRLRAEKELAKKKKKKPSKAEKIERKNAQKISQVEPEKIRKIEKKSKEDFIQELDFTIEGLIEEEEPKQADFPKERSPKIKKQEKVPKAKIQKITSKPKIQPFQKSEKRRLSKKWIVLGSILVIVSLGLVCFYFTNEEFEANVDEYIFHKNKVSEDLISIPLDASKDPKVIAYNGNLAVLSENTLKGYNTVGNEIGNVSLKVNNPIYETDGKYLIIGEKNSPKLYLVDHMNIAWEKEIEGSISRVAVNKNGYSAIVITDTSYKSIVALYDEKGKELFKIYLSTTAIVDIDLSDDNQYLGMAEIDTNGTQIQSTIKMVDIKKGQTNPNEAIIYTHKAEAGRLIVDIAFQSRGRLICMYDHAIEVTTASSNEEILKLSDNGGKANFAEINLDGSVYRVLEQSAGLFKANTVIEMVNTTSKKKTIHTVDGIAKSTHAQGNRIILNLGSEIEFLTDSGWVSKRYTTSKAIKDIVVSGSVAGIVYRDQVEIINL